MVTFNQVSPPGCFGPKGGWAWGSQADTGEALVCCGDGDPQGPCGGGERAQHVEAPYGWAAARLGVGPAPHLFRAPTQSLGGGGCGPDPPNLRLQETRQAPKE